MKLLTLNTHSLQEPGYSDKLPLFVRTVLEIRPDLIAMQEVNQTMTSAPVPPSTLEGYIPAVGHTIPVLEDNHAMRTACCLRDAGLNCFWTWLPVKQGYGKYDEGLALLSLGAPIASVDSLQLSRRSDYGDWRTRKALGVRLSDTTDWFYTVHMGWWKDETPFTEQWNALELGTAGKKKAGPVWLLGDFNAPAHVRGESYDLVASSGWLDTYCLANEKDSGITVQGPIDGWQNQGEGLRIDYIWCSERLLVEKSQIVFDGKKGPVVSDHFGVLVEIKEERS